MNRDRKKKGMDRSLKVREELEREFYNKINVVKSSFNYRKVKKNPSKKYLIETPLNYLKQEV